MATPRRLESARMDRRVMIQQIDETQDSTGSPVADWTELATVWAELVEQSSGAVAAGYERMMASGFQANQIRTFRIRYRDDVTNKHRILYPANDDGIAHDIISIGEIGRREGLEIVTLVMPD